LQVQVLHGASLNAKDLQRFANMKKKAVCHWLATFRAKRPWSSETTEFSSLVCSDSNINPLLKGDRKIVAIAS
jgi:hypothetical protein